MSGVLGGGIIKLKLMRKNKYIYLKVIQQNFGQGWEDVSEYETDSLGNPMEIHTPEIRVQGVGGKWLVKRKVTLLSYDLKEYKLSGYLTRVIRRKELNT